MAVLYTNNASTTLNGAINNSVTSMAVASSTGNLFPIIASPDVCYLTITDGTYIEIVKVIARANNSDTLTLATRGGYDGTAARSWSAGATVELRVCAALLDSKHPLNERVVAASATTGTLTINCDIADQYEALGLTGAITLAAPSGTPTPGQKLIIRLKDNGTARGITWTTGSSGAFQAVGIVLPTTTVVNKLTYVGCIWNATESRWDAVAVVTQA